MSGHAKGNFALLLAAMVWGTGFIGQRIGMRYMPPIGFNAIRHLMATVVLIPIALYFLKKSAYFDSEKNSEEMLIQKRNKLLKGSLVCGLFMFLGTAVQQIGLVTVSAGKSGFISSIYIALVPLVNVIFGGKVKLRTILCIVMALVGFAVLSLRGNFESITTGDWLTLASAFFIAVQIVAVSRFVDKDNAIALSVGQMVTAGLMGIVISMLIEDMTWAGFVDALPVLLYMTFVPTTIGYTMQIVGQTYTEEPSVAALILSLEAVFAAIFGAIFLRELMSVQEIIGCIIIFIATILGQYEPKQKIKADL